MSQNGTNPVRNDRFDNLYQMFRVRPTRLTPEQQKTATFHERFESIFLYVLKMVGKWHNGNTPSEQANCDLNDAVSEIYIELAEKDEFWKPESGRYITYATEIIWKRLADLREEIRTIKSPYNSSSTLKKAKAGIDGIQTYKQWRSEAFLSRTRNTCSINQDIHGSGKELSSSVSIVSDEDEESSGAREDRAVSNDALYEALAKCTPVQIAIVGHRHQLWGRPKMSVADISRTYGIKRDLVKTEYRLAMDTLKASILSRWRP